MCISNDRISIVTLIRLLLRLVLQRIKQYHSSWKSYQSAKQARKAPAQHPKARRKIAVVALGCIVVGGSALIVFHEFEISLQNVDRSRASLTLHFDFVTASPTVVYLEPWPAEAKPVPERDEVVQITIKNNLFSPAFQVVPHGSTVEVVNHDSILHNAHVLDEDDTVFNVATPLQAVSVRKTLTATGVLKVRCDLHSWMHAWIFVPPSQHSTILNKPGTVEFSDIQPKTYRLRVWQQGEFKPDVILVLKPGEAKVLRNTL